MFWLKTIQKIFSKRPVQNNKKSSKEKKAKATFLGRFSAFFYFNQVVLLELNMQEIN
jgi:hypothetical protein